MLNIPPNARHRSWPHRLFLRLQVFEPKGAAILLTMRNARAVCLADVKSYAMFDLAAHPAVRLSARTILLAAEASYCQTRSFERVIPRPGKMSRAQV